MALIAPVGLFHELRGVHALVPYKLNFYSYISVVLRIEADIRWLDGVR